MGKYLLYQPLHGLGVELHMLEIAMLLGKLLGRTVVVPLIPLLETHFYKEGLDYYFNLPKSFDWISNKEFMISHKKINKLYNIIPKYKKEYNNKRIRETHPVWLDSIINYPYFSKIGYEVESECKIDIEEPLNEKKVRSIFETSHDVIAITYLNGVLDNSFYKKNIGKDSYRFYESTPSTPSEMFLNTARSIIENKHYTAIHWRRGMNMDIILQELRHGQKLPEIERVYRRIPEEHKYIFFSSDVEVENFEPGRPIEQISYQINGDPNNKALIDMCICILSDYFIGNIYSSFSQYIFHSRCQLGIAENKNFFIN